MRALTNIRIATSEPVTLECAGADSVRITPRLSQPMELEAPAGAVQFPLIAAPDVAKVEWTRDGSTVFLGTVEVVGCHYFPLDALKDYGDGQDLFSERTDDELFVCRQAATEVFEQNARRSFVRRLGRTGDWGYDNLVWCDHNDVCEVITPGYVQVSDCQLKRDPLACEDAGYPRWVEYLYGLDTIPSVVSGAVLELAAYMLRPTNRPIGATGESSDAGYIHFTVAGRDGATAVPEVNAVIEQFGRGPRYVM